jgi:hypothetical protein
MKTIVLHLSDIFKKLSFTLLKAFLTLLTFSQCVPEEMATFEPDIGRMGYQKIAYPIPSSIPPDEVVRKNYPGATSWLITFHDPDINSQWSYQRFFSTLDGSFHTLDELNSSTETTLLADLDFLFAYINSPDKYNGLFTQPRQVKETRLKPSIINLLELVNMKVHEPELFQTKYEESPWEGINRQPMDYATGEASPYQPGEVFLFKTDRNPAKYGVIRILEKPSFVTWTGTCKVEVIVQADNMSKKND